MLLTAYLVSVGLVALAGLVVFGVNSRKTFTQPETIRTYSQRRLKEKDWIRLGDLAMKEHRAGDIMKYPRPIGGMYMFCGIGGHQGRVAFCEKHAAAYDTLDKDVYTDAPNPAKPQAARNAMRGWAIFCVSPVWPLLFGYVVRNVYRKVRKIAATPTPAEIKEDRLLHMALDPRVADEPRGIEAPKAATHPRTGKTFELCEGCGYYVKGHSVIPGTDFPHHCVTNQTATRQPVFYDTAREKMFFETDSYKTLMGEKDYDLPPKSDLYSTPSLPPVRRLNDPKATLPKDLRRDSGRLTGEEYWKFMDAPRPGAHEYRDPTCKFAGEMTHGLHLRKCPVCNGDRDPFPRRKVTIKSNPKARAYDKGFSLMRNESLDYEIEGY